MKHAGILAGMIACVLMAACGPSAPETDWSGEKVAREVRFPMARPELEQLVIRNYSRVPVAFSFRLNDGVFATMEQMLAHIRSMEEVWPGEPPESKAWRFVSDHSFVADPVNGERRLHHPLILLNSLGRGYCDDASAALVAIWREMGLPARVWTLEGHVVAEVRAGDGWHLYDPSLFLRFPGVSDSALGMDSLQARPGLIRRGRPQASAAGLPGFFDPEGMYEIYSTTTDNRVETWYDSIPPAGPGEFRLPPGGEIRLRSLGRGQRLYGFFPPEASALLELRLPAGFRGRQPYPLYVLGVEGELSAEERGKLDRKELFLDEIAFAGGDRPVTVLCALNPLMFQFEKDNRLALLANHPDSLDLEVRPLEGRSLRWCRKVLRFNDRVNADLQRSLHLRDSLPPVRHPGDLAHNAGLLLLHQPGFAVEDTTAAVQEFVARMESVFGVEDSLSRAGLCRMLSPGADFIHVFSMVRNLAALGQVPD